MEKMNPMVVGPACSMKMSWERCVQTIREMMADRGYTLWVEAQGVVICSSLCHRRQAMVYICQFEKFNIESVKYAVSQMQQHQMKHIIIAYQNIITSSAKKAIDHLQDYTIELFEKKEMQYNPTRHTLYCPHVRVSKEECGIPANQVNLLPVLLRTDAVARYFHFNRGDVVRIRRKNGTLAFRIVK